MLEWEVSLRVCFVCPNLYGTLIRRDDSMIGGAERQQALLAGELARRGVGTAFVVADRGQPRRISTTLGPAFAGPPGSPSRVPGERFARDAAGIVRAMAAADADVYYLRTSTPDLLPVVAYCRAKRRVSLFATANDQDLRRPLWLAPTQRRIFAVGLRLVDGLIVQHEGQAREAAGSVGRAIAIVPSAVELPELPSLDAEGARPIVLVARPSPVKRADVFVALAARIPDHPFLLVGDVHQDARARFASRGLAWPANLTVTGMMPHHEVLATLARAAFIVSTSESEGVPNVLLEAFAAGKPAITLGIDPGGRLSSDNLGVVAADEDALAAATRRLLDATDLRHAMGARARAYVERHHAVPRTADALLACVRGLRAG